jgi:hypothetical protein
MPSKQAPIQSGFGPTTTAREAIDGIDLSGTVAIVSGGYSGIGLETTRVLAEAGATVIVPARNPDKARKALNADLRGFGLSRENSSPGSVPAGRSVAEGGDFKTIEQGAATSVWCTTSPRLAGMGGVYCLDVDIAEVLPSDSAIGAGVQPRAIDPKNAERLWTLSEELTGVKVQLLSGISH